MSSEENSLNEITVSINQASATLNNETEATISTTVKPTDKVESSERSKEEAVKSRPRSLSAALSQSDTNQNEICPICLLQITKEERSFAGTCFHTFCYECLLEWSKIKSSCPLCKQLFSKIYYKIKSVDDYREHVIKQPGPRSELSSFIGVFSMNSINGRRNIPISYASNFMNMQNDRMSFEHLFNNILQHGQAQPLLSVQVCRWANGVGPAPVCFRRLVYVNEWRVNPNEIQVQTANASTFQQVHNFRDTSPSFFSHNQACTHRLSLFLSRELRALSYHTFTPELRTPSRDLIHGLILNWIRTHEIGSDIFLNHISHYIKPERFARHFQHEFKAYAQSVCHNVIDYDSKCVYYDSAHNRVNLGEYRRAVNGFNNDEDADVLNLPNENRTQSDNRFPVNIFANREPARGKSIFLLCTQSNSVWEEVGSNKTVLLFFKPEFDFKSQKMLSSKH
jgi:hypothetical protein